jgi:hypothetical protein
MLMRPTVARPLALAASVLALSAGAAMAQVPYTQTPAGQQQQQQQQQGGGQDAILSILGALFGDRLGLNTSLDSQWAANRRPLADQRNQFHSRVDAEVRSGALNWNTSQRLKTDYDALVELESRYGADRRFTNDERADLRRRYDALTQAATGGGYDDGYGGGYGQVSIADGRSAFEARVDASVRDRRINRTEGSRLKSDYRSLINVEAGYLRDGYLSANERSDLSTRLDALNARVRDGYGNGGGGWPSQDPRERLNAIERAVASGSVSSSVAAQIRVEHGDLVRLEAALSRLGQSADDRAYLERRISDLEQRARIRR